jgi:hypothetical protein
MFVSTFFLRVLGASEPRRSSLRRRARSAEYRAIPREFRARRAREITRARQREREVRVKKKPSRPQKNVDLYFCNS